MVPAIILQKIHGCCEIIIHYSILPELCSTSARQIFLFYLIHLKELPLLRVSLSLAYYEGQAVPYFALRATKGLRHTSTLSASPHTGRSLGDNISPSSFVFV